MGNEFLYQVAEVFWREKGDALRNYCFVFPNRRSSLFFQKYLGLVASKPVFSPTTITINTLFSQLSGLRTSDKIYSLYQLYCHYISFCEGERRESFDDFIFWGDMILNDFDDVDKYLVDARKLFSNIKDLQELNSGYDFLSDRQRKAIEGFWGNIIPFSENRHEKSFLSLWNTLYDIYSSFRKSLLDRGEGYEGMIYRTVAQSLSSLSELPESLKQYDKIVFVGLNALNECEKKLLDFLKKEGIADFYWDYYGKIIKDKQNKSSFFMDENVIRYPSLYPLKDGADSHENSDRKIEVIGIPSSVGQAKYVNKILHSLFPEDTTQGNTPFSTAVVLPDEGMLLPVINSIPENIDKVNVTMGYSLANTELSSFMKLIAQIHSDKRFRIEGDKVSFYHVGVRALLSHPYIAKIAGKDVPEIRRSIISKNLIYVPSEELDKNEILNLIFSSKTFIELYNSNSVSLLADYLLSILIELNKYIEPMDKEFVMAYYKSINRLKGLNLPISIDTYFTLLSRIVSSISVPFKGEPLSGLQIMGPLETRALDFENVIILSVNEGVFPSTSVSSSFIPYNLRKGFNLPNYEFQDSISAYHFYRSIYRAKKVFLLYDTRGEGVGRSGEVSRYVKQLKYHHEVPLKENLISYKLQTAHKEKIVINKSDEMVSKLEKLHFSASLVNTYLDCSLRFYFKKIEEIDEEEDVVEDIESDTFGILFHKVMEMLYDPYKGSIISDKILKSISNDDKHISFVISSAFNSELGIKEISGKNKIIEALIIRYVKEILTKDIEHAPFTYIASEKKCLMSIKTRNGRTLSVNGFIDRIDEKDNITRIIDYKTGGYNISHKSVEDMFDSSMTLRPYTSLQMMLYLYFLLKEGAVDDIESVKMCIISLKELFKGGKGEFVADKEMLLKFEVLFKEVLDDIFDTSKPFTATDDVDKCERCPYKIICNR